MKAQQRQRTLPSLFDSRRKLLIGVVHLLPLPGSPRWAGQIKEVVSRAVADARAYEQGGADALIVENFGDVPFTKGAVPPETVAAMAVAGTAVCAAVRVPIGFNVLRNDARAALGLCAACGGSFLRVNVHCGAMLTDQGIIEGQAFETLRRRRELCPGVALLADVQVKHATPLAPMPIETAARDTLERGLADGLILSGTGTGQATDLEDVRRVSAACPRARLFVGSGVTVGNASEYLGLVDGVIVGSSLKLHGRVANRADPKRVAALARVISASR
jgi:membrane complex biogenesis BtpA family protein